MALSANSVARGLGIDLQHVNLRQGTVLFLPQHIVVLAQGASASTYSTDKFQATSHVAVGNKVGFGSLMHLISMQLHPANGDGVGAIPVTYLPLEDDYDGVAATGSITPSGTQTKAGSYFVRVGGILSAPFVVATTDAVADICDKITAAVAAIPEMPMIPTDNTTNVGFAAKWDGPSGNALVIEVIGEALGVTYTITQPNGGLIDPDITTALAQLSEEDWYTMGINGVGQTAAVLDELQTWGEGRWTLNIPKPLPWFSGTAETDPLVADDVPEGRADDRVNGQLVCPGSPDHPAVIAARQIARAAVVANENPPTGYGAETTDLIPGDDADQWTYDERDIAVKAGSSTVIVKNGVVEIGEIVTFYHPTGEEPPAYRYLVDIVRLQNVSYNVWLRFGAKSWASAPLIPDDEPTTNENARKPMHAKAEMADIIEGLGNAAIISDRAAAQESMVIGIDADQPKKLNITVNALALSGNTQVKDATIKWGFYFPAAA